MRFSAPRPFLSLLFLQLAIVAGEPPPYLSILPKKSGPDLLWEPGLPNQGGSAGYPFFELQRSSDLLDWEPVSERFTRGLTNPPSPFAFPMALDSPRGFYRLLRIDRTAPGGLASGGAEIFGYSATLAEELKEIGQISPAEFAAMFPNPAEYLPQISWDPTTAPFWAEFNNPAASWFRGNLSTAELGLFQTNGFVVSERLGSASFANLFYILWKQDLPIFISCDALLQAWHRTYDAMLEEVEEIWLSGAVDELLNEMAGKIPALDAEIADPTLKQSLLDADYFLTVARSLSAGATLEPSLPAAGQSQRINQTLADIRDLQLKTVSDFMGFCRVVDFSQFAVRGHYTHTLRLQRYFQTVIWLGRTDIPVAGGPWRRCPGVERFASPRELGAAIVLWDLLRRSGQFERWRDIERTLSVFVGTTDSLNFAQLGGLLAGAGVRSVADIRDSAKLLELQAEIVRGELGVQNIRSDWFEQPVDGAARYALPQTFTVLGQKFVPDSWAFSQTVAASILWTEGGQTNKVPRRVPGSLDVAFSVLANDQVVPDLVSQMNGTFPDPDRPHARQFRDGLPYQHNLAAVRRVMDRVNPAAWESNIYMEWLACLRELSRPTTGPEFPEAMRTRAWAMKTLNTQLASWTHLRHDTVLYAKQSYTDFLICVYPTGFVEPRLDFWRRFERMAAGAAEQIAGLTYRGEYEYVEQLFPFNPGVTNRIEASRIQARQVDHLRNFASLIARLAGLAEKELNKVCFSAQDEKFMDSLIEASQGMGCGDGPRYTGWYPQLFYRTIYSSDRDFHTLYGAGAYDALITDVHTDVPSITPPDPGSVLHEAVGKVNLLMLAVDNGLDRFICAGPVLSHYELEVIGDPRRITDQEWHGDDARGSPFSGILVGRFPSDLPASRIEGLRPPAWTRSFLVPK